MKKIKIIILLNLLNLFTITQTIDCSKIILQKTITHNEKAFFNKKNFGLHIIGRNEATTKRYVGSINNNSIQFDAPINVIKIHYFNKNAKFNKNIKGILRTFCFEQSARVFAISFDEATDQLILTPKN